MANTPESTFSVSDSHTASTPTTEVESADGEQNSFDSSGETIADSSASDTSSDSDTTPNPSTGTSESSGDTESAPKNESETSRPQNEEGSCRASGSELNTLASDGNGDSGGSSGGMLTRGELSPTALVGFGVLTIFCLVMAFVILRTILEHGMVHAPTHLWVVFYVAFLTPLVVAVGGARVVSLVKTADDIAPDKRQNQTGTEN